MGIRSAKVGTLALVAGLAGLVACSSDAASPTTAPATSSSSSSPSSSSTADTAPSVSSSSGPSIDATDRTDDTAPTTAASVDAPTTTSSELPRASFSVLPGTEQVAIVGAEPGTDVELVAPDGSVVGSGTVDEQGSLLFRDFLPADGWRVRTATEQSDPFTIARRDDVPDPRLYENQDQLPAGGFGYIETRDGTTLSANVILPGPAEDGPYPTVVEYSGYQPSDPGSADLAGIYNALGFAYVGVNMRGTGCSGGSYRFFEIVQSLDGYDAIEAVAAQPWVLDHEVGMVGISYPGISQLFVAATQPPSLAAITPLSVVDDSYRSTLYPGGILNTGFAVEWTQDRMDESRPFGQEWAQERADAGDTVCADNQQLRLQNPDLVAEIDANPFYASPLGDSLAPATFVDRIEVPVFLAGAWQDEQTGGRFPAMLPNFTGSPHVYVTLTNGLHTESILPGVMQRYAEFLQLYVGKTVPDMEPVNGIVPVLAQAITGVADYPAYVSRFAGQSYEDALAAFEAEPSITVNFEEGAADGVAPGAPYPRFTKSFQSWPIPSAHAIGFYLGAGGQLSTMPPTSSAREASSSSYVADPDALPATFFDGDDIWSASAEFDWRPLPDGTGVGFATPPLTHDVTIIGSGSVNLWISATKDGSPVDDTDIEVTVSEITPDGNEVYVQSGWLRASQRALDTLASSPLRPVHTNAEADAAPLDVEDFTAVRVELFPVAHVFREGSRIRLTIDAPGNNRGEWEFDTIDDGETITIAHDFDHRSSLVLAVLGPLDDDAPAGVPPCGSLRGQPCRRYVPAANGG